MAEEIARRSTKQRRVILETIRQLGCHPTADQIYEAVKRKLPKTSLSTIYRNLGILVDQGEIATVKGECQELHYDHELEDHCHIQCSICGRICDVDAYPDKIEQLSLEELSGFVLQEIRINLVGICPECYVNMEKEKDR